MGKLNLGKCHSCQQKTSTEYRGYDTYEGHRTKCCDKWICDECICWVASDSDGFICKDCCNCEDEEHEEIGSTSSSSSSSTSYLELKANDFFDYNKYDDYIYKATDLYRNCMIVIIGGLALWILYCIIFVERGL